MKKSEMKRAVSQGHLGLVKRMKIDTYMPVMDLPTRFQVPLLGWSVKGAPAAIGEIKGEMEKAVSQGYLERFEPKGSPIYIPILVSKCRFQVSLPG